MPARGTGGWQGAADLALEAMTHLGLGLVARRCSLLRILHRSLRIPPDGWPSAARGSFTNAANVRK